MVDEAGRYYGPDRDQREVAERQLARPASEDRERHGDDREHEDPGDEKRATVVENGGKHEREETRADQSPPPHAFSSRVAHDADDTRAERPGRCG